MNYMWNGEKLKLDHFWFDTLIFSHSFVRFRVEYTTYYDFYVLQSKRKKKKLEIVSNCATKRQNFIANFFRCFDLSFYAANHYTFIRNLKWGKRQRRRHRAEQTVNQTNGHLLASQNEKTQAANDTEKRIKKRYFLHCAQNEVFNILFR